MDDRQRQATIPFSFTFVYLCLYFHRFNLFADGSHPSNHPGFVLFRFDCALKNGVKGRKKIYEDFLNFLSFLTVILQNRQSIVFSSILFNGMNMLTNTVILFPMERAVITREFQNGTYRMIAYYLSRIITSITFLLVYVFFYVTILYFLAGLFPSAKQYLMYISAVCLVGMIAVTLGLIIGALVPSVNLGPSLVTPVLMPLIVFSGFLISHQAIAKPFLLFYYISFFQYAFNILVVTQFQPLQFDCCCVQNSTEPCICGGKNDLDTEGHPIACPPYCDCEPIGNTTDYHVYEEIPDDVLAPTCMLGSGCHGGAEYLQQMQFPEGHVARDFVVLAGMWVFLAFCGFYVMLWRGRKKSA